ncbi:hypothetical protein NQZ68_003577 [Dissostichus eleginoides]|nr:hypothetical protein NQZ68_003577 [Dissostichus eleginoides]
MTRRLSVLGGELEGAGEGWDENRIILTLPFPKIHNALKDTVSIQRPPPLSFYDKLRHSTIWLGPGYMNGCKRLLHSPLSDSGAACLSLRPIGVKLLVSPSGPKGPKSP